MIIITTFPKTLTEEKKLILVRKDVDVNESLSNYTFRNKLKVKEQCFYCCSTFHLDWISLG